MLGVYDWLFGVTPLSFDAFAGVEGAVRMPLICGGMPFRLWMPFGCGNAGGGLDGGAARKH